MKRSAHSKQERTRSSAGLADSAHGDRKAGEETAGAKRRSRQPRRKGQGPSRPTSRLSFGLLGAVAVALVAGGIGWRLHARSAAPAAPKAVGMPQSPEEAALERAAEQRPHDPEPWRKLGQLYLVHRQPFEA